MSHTVIYWGNWLQYFGHLMQRTESLEKTLMLGKIEGQRKGDDRGWDSWMPSLMRYTWVRVSSGSWWWTGKPGVLQSMGWQRVRHDWVTELNWNCRRRNYSHIHIGHSVLLTPCTGTVAWSWPPCCESDAPRTRQLIDTCPRSCWQRLSLGPQIHSVSITHVLDFWHEWTVCVVSKLPWVRAQASSCFYRKQTPST